MAKSQKTLEELGHEMDVVGDLLMDKEDLVDHLSEVIESLAAIRKQQRISDFVKVEKDLSDRRSSERKEFTRLTQKMRRLEKTYEKARKVGCKHEHLRCADCGEKVVLPA